MSLTSLLMWSHNPGCQIFHCNFVICHRDIISTCSKWPNYSPSSEWWPTIHERPFLFGITSHGSNALEQFPPIRIPIIIFSIWVISSAILSKYFYSLMLLVVTTSSSPTGKSVLEYVTGRSIQTDSPIIASDSWVSSPFKALILIVVFIPTAFSFLAKSVLINIP